MEDRLSIRETADGFEARIAARRDPRATWLGGLVVFGLVAVLVADALFIYRALSSTVTAVTAIPFVLLFFVSLYWTPIVYGWLWNLTGREIVCVHDGKMRVERVVLRNMRFAYEFDLLDIENVRVRPEPDDSSNLTLRHQQARFGLGGNVAFDAEGRPFRVGIGLPEEDAGDLAEALNDAVVHDFVGAARD